MPLFLKGCLLRGGFTQVVQSGAPAMAGMLP